jgi:hypothetical protein
MITEEVTQAQLKDLEKFADRLLNKFNVDIEFTKHFADRMNDDRNKPAIKISELQAFFKKIAKVKAKNIKAHVNSEVVLKDLQKDLNLPVAINLDKQGDIEVTHKTIMRKKNFTTPNQVIQYEETDINEQFISFLYPMSETAKFALLRKSEESGYVVEVLEDVYTRGLAAYDSEKHSKLLPEQYAFARINSFIKGGKARLMDADLIDDRRTFKEWTLENPGSGWHSTKNKRVIPLKQKNGMYHPHDVKDTEMLRAVTGKHTLSADDLKYAHGAAHRQGYKLDVVKDK